MRRVATIVVALAIGVTALAGCGGGGDGDSSTTTAGPQVPDQAALEEMQQCLAEQGVEMPDVTPPAAGEAPTGSPPKLDRKTQKALEKCGGGAPSGAPPTSNG
jgi:hypothetical protein